MFPSRNVKYFPVEREAYFIGKGKHSLVEMGNPFPWDKAIFSYRNEKGFPSGIGNTFQLLPDISFDCSTLSTNATSNNFFLVLTFLA